MPALQTQGIGLLGRTNHHGYFYATIAREIWLYDASIRELNQRSYHRAADGLYTFPHDLCGSVVAKSCRQRGQSGKVDGLRKRVFVRGVHDCL